MMGADALDSFRMEVDHQKDQGMIRGLELSALPPTPGEERGLEIDFTYQ